MSAKARAIAAAAAAALAASAMAAAQEDEEEAAPTEEPLGADPSVCGRSFAASGVSTSVAYAAVQLRTCDALLVSSSTRAELEAAADTIATAHQGVLERWRAVGEELITAAADPRSARVARPAAEEEAPAEASAEGGGAQDGAAPAAPATDPWSVKLAERHALETAMDGLRILMRLSYQLSENFADPANLAAALEGPAAARVSEILEGRQVCASAARAARRGEQAGDPASWLAHATLFPQTPDEEPVTYEREIVDEMAGIAERFLTTDLRSAPGLAITTLRSYETKAACAVDEFPSERAEGA